jgi:catechol 2,3-dioxygenase-like lactoylglutathione lyase family enzyme
MKTTQLNHVALHVADVERSCEFYRRVLQLEPLTRPAFSFPSAWFRLGADQELHLIGDRSEEVHSHNRGNHFALMVDDIDAWETHLRQQPIEVRPRRTRPDGAHQIFLIDPDGHYIELCTPPGVAPAGS